MQGLYQHHLHLITQFIQYEMFMNQQDLKNDINALDDQNSENPVVVTAKVVEIDAENIAWVHQVKKIWAFFVVGVYFVDHLKKSG